MSHGAPKPMKNPAKALRGIMAGTLIMETIVVLLALPVIAKLGGGIGTLGGVLVGVLALLMLLATGVVRFRWGIWVALALQVAMIACGVFVFTLGVLGVIFGLIWLYLLWLRKQLDQSLAAAAAQQ
ncbi:ABC-type multidrug transport system permease subunit [Crossiella equi]|uniref:ABC-type multidrug transport system permease subunit n=1 Tax=Crossiella equi TaxID=130796 RepID=A0ABS5AC65_9PSEU|nr:DUF4233 domain-containing protein [Crossiella equi]MBP2474173.1 ABC-type multidrug transport system permease subunit [Crossiella equi]